MNSLINKGVLTTDMLNVLMDRYHIEIQRNGDYNYFKVKTITVDEDTLALLKTNYIYNLLEDYQPVPVDISEEEVEEFPEIHGNLDDLAGVLLGVALEVPVEEEDLEITDEDIEAAFTNIVRDELKSELIALEEESPEPEEEPNNNQKEQDATDNFEWF
jgi:hypothetical protein